MLARGASVGVNVLGTGVMLATFLHTGGLTGAEVGIAAATAFLNQKLLTALFGEAAMVEMIPHAGGGCRRCWRRRSRRSGRGSTSTCLRLASCRTLATELRAAAREVRALTEVAA